MVDIAQKIRVLVITDEMEVGGTQRQIVHLVLGLDRNRFEPTVLYFRNRSFFVDQLERAGISVIRVDKHRRIDLGFVYRLRRVVGTGKYDVMHCFALSGELWGAVVQASLGGRNRPVLFSSIRNNFDWDRPMHCVIKQWVMRRSWRVVANSEAGARNAQQHMRLPPGLIQVVYNGVDVPTLAPQDAASVRAELDIASDVSLVLFVGRLIAQKDVATLLRAMHRLRGTQTVLAIAGSGELRQSLELQAEALGLDNNVRFLGQRSDTTALMSAADMVVLPSVVEGLSNVVLESMICGRVVIASRTGGNVELVEHEQTGLLFDVGDDEALAACIRRLHRSPQLRTTLGAAARDKALRGFTIPAMVAAFTALYETAPLRPAARG